MAAETAGNCSCSKLWTRNGRVVIEIITIKPNGPEATAKRANGQEKKVIWHLAAAPKPPNPQLRMGMSWPK